MELPLVDQDSCWLGRVMDHELRGGVTARRADEVTQCAKRKRADCQAGERYPRPRIVQRIELPDRKTQHDEQQGHGQLRRRLSNDARAGGDAAHPRRGVGQASGLCPRGLRMKPLSFLRGGRTGKSNSGGRAVLSPLNPDPPVVFPGVARFGLGMRFSVVGVAGLPVCPAFPLGVLGLRLVGAGWSGCGELVGRVGRGSPERFPAGSPRPVGG